MSNRISERESKRREAFESVELEIGFNGSFDRYLNGTYINDNIQQGYERFIKGIEYCEERTHVLIQSRHSDVAKLKDELIVKDAHINLLQSLRDVSDKEANAKEVMILELESKLKAADKIIKRALQRMDSGCHVLSLGDSHLSMQAYRVKYLISQKDTDNE